MLRRFALWILVRFNFAECYILWRLYSIVSRQKCRVAFAVVILSVRLFVSLSVTPAIKVKTAEHVVSFFIVLINSCDEIPTHRWTCSNIVTRKINVSKAKSRRLADIGRKHTVYSSKYGIPAYNQRL